MNTVSHYLLTLGGQAVCQENPHYEIMDHEFMTIAQLNEAPPLHVKHMVLFKVRK